MVQPRSSFCCWYQLYQKDSYEGLADKQAGAKRIWNTIPEEGKEQVVDMALRNPEKSCRLSAGSQLAGGEVGILSVGGRGAQPGTGTCHPGRGG